MELSFGSRFIKNCLLLAALIPASLTFYSCDAMIYDEEGDCTPHYRLCFKYTRNILNADAFGSQVTDIHVAVYDKNGNLELRHDDTRTATEENNYYMELDCAPGIYQILAWCEGISPETDAVSFTFSGQSADSPITSSGAYFNTYNSPEGYYFDKDLNPLYYGRLENVIISADDYGIINLPPVSLTKDTNHINIMLQNVDGNPIDPDILTFTLEGRNNSLDWQNQLNIATDRFFYQPWHIRSVYTEDTRTEIPSGVQADFTTGRIMADVEQRLRVTIKETGREILNIPLVEYLLLIRDKYNQTISAQDYLDRINEFTMVFYMGEGYEWINSKVLINGWRVVPPQNEKI